MKKMMSNQVTYVSPSWSGVKAAIELQLIYCCCCCCGLHDSSCWIDCCCFSWSIESIITDDDDKSRSLSIQRPESVAATGGILVTFESPGLWQVLDDEEEVLDDGTFNDDDDKDDEESMMFVKLIVPAEYPESNNDSNCRSLDTWSEVATLREAVSRSPIVLYGDLDIEQQKFQKIYKIRIYERL